MADQETVDAMASEMEKQEQEITRLRAQLQAKDKDAGLIKLPMGDLVRPFSRDRERPDTLGRGQVAAAAAPEIDQALGITEVSGPPEPTAEEQAEDVMDETARTLD
jgi:hypothetical protein